MSELKQIRYPAKYIAELFDRDVSDFDPRCALADETTAGIKNIFQFYIGPKITDTSNYWIQWGGYFDNITGYGLQIFFNQFLIMSPTKEDMLITENSFYIDEENDKCYLNLTYNPWQYFERLVYIYDNEGTTYSSAVKDEKNKSDQYYGNVKALPILMTPVIENKISDAISGVEVYNEFKIELFNEDGRFDDIDISKYNNTPVRISKTTNNAQTLSEFETIRKGVFDNIEIDNRVVITATDQLYKMDKDVCRRITADEFVGADEDIIGENIPIAWGYHYGIELIFLYESGGTYYYIAIDKDYLTNVIAVYDKDEVSQSFSVDYLTGIISTSTEVETCDFRGKYNSDSKLGKIITDILFSIENINYTAGIWDVDETDSYIDLSAEINLFIDGGTTKELVNSALQNDIAFLIQKNSGLLTLRRWGIEYNRFDIANWLITQQPKKTFSNANKYFCSTVVVKYGQNSQYVDDSQEQTIFDANNGRSYTATLETVIKNEDDAIDLAERFLDRFGGSKLTIENIGLGVDTFEINLLDVIRIEVLINDRILSDYSEWVVTGCDPGQDKLTLEAKDILYVLTFDGYDAEVDNNYLLSVDN